MKKLFFSLAMVAMMIASPLAFAATIDGMVTQEGGSPLKYDGYVIAYWWDEEVGEYVEMAMDQVDKSKIDFLLMDLPEGSYYLVTGAEGYVTEYYNDTLNFDEREEIWLLEDDSFTCDPIELKRTPYLILEASLNTEIVSPGGQTIKLTANVQNNTGRSAKLYVWPTVTTQGSPEYGTPQSVFQPQTARPYTIKPNTKTSISYLIRVPSDAPNNRDYTVNLFGGNSYWDPTVQHKEAGTFFKGNDGWKVRGGGKSAPQIPLRVSGSGAVLEWK